MVSEEVTLCSLQVLMNHIRDKLPDMKAKLNTLMGQAEQELHSFGDAAVFGDKNQVSAPSHSYLNRLPYLRLHLFASSKVLSSSGL